jgi:hypothetical protein
MEGVADLREQARQWRRIAERYTPGLARALIQAAASLEARADQIEATPGVPPEEPVSSDRSKKN